MLPVNNCFSPPISSCRWVQETSTSWKLSLSLSPGDIHKLSMKTQSEGYHSSSMNLFHIDMEIFSRARHVVGYTNGSVWQDRTYRANGRIGRKRPEVELLGQYSKRTCGGGTRGGSVLLDMGVPRTSLKVICYELRDLQSSTLSAAWSSSTLSADLSDKLCGGMSGGGKE